LFWRSDYWKLLRHLCCSCGNITNLSVPLPLEELKKVTKLWKTISENNTKSKKKSLWTFLFVCVDKIERIQELNVLTNLRSLHWTKELNLILFYSVLIHTTLRSLRPNKNLAKKDEVWNEKEFSCLQVTFPSLKQMMRMIQRSIFAFTHLQKRKETNLIHFLFVLGPKEFSSLHIFMRIVWKKSKHV